MDDINQCKEEEVEEEEEEEQEEEQEEQEESENARTNEDSGKNENLVVRRYGKRNKELHLNSSPQDLFVTQKEDILVLLPYIADFKGKRVFDPCCGTGVIGKVLRQENFTEDVVESDKFIGNERKDYLVDDDPEYDLLLTNPPYAQKLAFLTKAFESRKPFCFLLPSDTLFYVGTSSLFRMYGIIVLVIFPRPRFLRNGKLVNPTSTSYFIGNLALNVAGRVEVFYVDKTDRSVEELSDESTKI